MLLENNPARWTSFWTAVGALGSFAAAIGACYAAFQAKATVREMKNERLERKKFEEPEISIDGVSIVTCEFEGNTDTPYFYYNIILNNIKENKLFNIMYSIALFYNSTLGPDVIQVSDIKIKRFNGGCPKIISTEMTIFDTEYTSNTIIKSIGFFIVKDVLLNEKKLMGQLGHKNEYEDCFLPRTTHWKEIEIVKRKREGDTQATDGICALDENISQKDIDVIINLVRERDDETFNFIASFSEKKKISPWYIRIFQ